MRTAGIASIVVLGLGCVVVATPAAAVSLTNRDDKEHKITVIQGETKTDRVVKPQEVVETVCPKACVIRLNDNEEDEYQLDAADVVSIEDGFLYYDNAEAGDDKDKPGAGATPPEKKRP